MSEQEKAGTIPDTAGVSVTTGDRRVVLADGDRFPHVIDAPRMKCAERLRRALEDEIEYWRQERKRLDALIASGTLSEPFRTIP